MSATDADIKAVLEASGNTPTITAARASKMRKGIAWRLGQFDVGDSEIEATNDEVTDFMADAIRQAWNNYRDQKAKFDADATVASDTFDS